MLPNRLIIKKWGRFCLNLNDFLSKFLLNLFPTKPDPPIIHILFS